MKDQHFTSRMLACAGALMTVSAILMAVCVKLAYGGILLAAHYFHIAEDKKAYEDQERTAEREKES